MSNRIDNYTATAAGSVRGSVKTADANSKASSSDAPVSNVARIDSAKFTPDAMKLQQMDSDIAKTPVSDNQRVAALRKAIANGSYNVDTKAVASKLARMEWDISGT